MKVSEMFEGEQKKADFYNLYTGAMVCGRCGKQMSSFRALFHYHWFYSTDNKGV